LRFDSGKDISPPPLTCARFFIFPFFLLLLICKYEEIRKRVVEAETTMRLGDKEL
jgi:hypothetical protein